MNYAEIRNNEEIRALLKKGNANLGVLGFTDHSTAHCALVAERAADILDALGYDEHTMELAKIAGFMHDIGNAINRNHHAEYGAILAYQILKDTDMPIEDRLTIVSAIGNHDEKDGVAVDAVSAALIIADKTDVRRSRVLSPKEEFDIHDRVNYAVTDADVEVDKENMIITLKLEVDENICTMYEYFEIFLGRMTMAKGAAEVFGAKFKLIVNGSKVL
ncbi:MAG: HD domain-containing protein [Lachnospiraceae bacterium]|nr:HD domain-containing protein [Lachnospiraceae bacterium]